MILLLGATSYIGQAFARALRRRKDSFIPLSRNAFDYTRFEFLFDYVRKIRPDLIINAAECAEKQNRELSDADRMEMLRMNTLLPQTIARVCSLTNTPLGHVSSGNIYSGAKVFDSGAFRIEDDLGLPLAHAMFDSHPEKFNGFSELDDPNFSFKSTACNFYSGTKALAEEALRNFAVFIWRLRLPFNEQDDPHNFLSQLQDGLKFYDAINSLSQLDECVGACLELWERRAPVGIYNIVNPGPLRTRDIVQMIHRFLKPTRSFELLVYDAETTANIERSLRSDCILEVSKLLGLGIRLRTAKQALEKALQKWERQSASVLQTSP